MPPMISVIIITYNQKNKVLRCLNSLLSSKTSDIELIVADDCSYDGTQEVLLNWIAQNQQSFHSLKLIRNEINKGTVANVIQAINTSTGKYIKLIAGDDWLCPEALDYLNNFANTTDFDVAFFPLLAAVENLNGEITTTSKSIAASKLPMFFQLSSTNQFNALAISNLLPAPGAIFSRDFWNLIKLWDYPFIFEEDWPMWLLGALNKVHFVEINKPLVTYLYHDQSVFSNTRSPIFKQVMKDIVLMHKMIILPNKNKLSRKNLIKVWRNYFIFMLLSKLPISLTHWILKLRGK